MVVNVGIGAGNKDQMLGHLQSIAVTQKLMREGGLEKMVTDKNLYNAAHAQVQNSGFRIDEFFTDPEAEAEDGREQMPEQQPDAAAMAAQAQIAMQDREMGQKDRELDMKEQQMMMEAEKAKAEMALKHRELTLKSMEGQMNALGEGGLTMFEELMAAIQGLTEMLASQGAPRTKEIRREDGSLVGRYTIQ